MTKTRLSQIPSLYALLREIGTVNEFDSTGESNILYPADFHPPGKIRYQ